MQKNILLQKNHRVTQVLIIIQLKLDRTGIEERNHILIIFARYISKSSIAQL